MKEKRAPWVSKRKKRERRSKHTYLGENETIYAQIWRWRLEKGRKIGHQSRAEGKKGGD